MSPREDLLCRDIEAVLLEEARALGLARFAELTALADRKERLFGTLDRAALGPEQLVRLHELAARNGALLEQTMRGLRAAIAVIETARNPQAAFATYDTGGRRRTLGTDGGAARRA